MDIDRTSDRPVYKQLADVLRTAIRRGELADGALLASETELMERYGVSRNSARNAVAVLRAEGLVVTEHGRGTFVRAHRPLRRLDSSRYAKAERQARRELLQTDPGQQEAEAAQDRLVGVEVVDPPTEIADRLELSDEKALVRRHLLFLDGEPVQLADRYFPLSIVQGTRIEKDENLPDGAHAELEHELGYELDRFVEELTFRMPTPEEARQLRTSAGAPVVRLLRTLYDTTGRALETSDFVLAGDRHVLVYEVPTS